MTREEALEKLISRYPLKSCLDSEPWYPHRPSYNQGSPNIASEGHSESSRGTVARRKDEVA